MNNELFTIKSLNNIYISLLAICLNVTCLYSMQGSQKKNYTKLQYASARAKFLDLKNQADQACINNELESALECIEKINSNNLTNTELAEVSILKATIFWNGIHRGRFFADFFFCFF